MIRTVIYAILLTTVLHLESNGQDFSIARSKELIDMKKYLPREIRGLQFNMAQADFLKKYDVNLTDEASFRTVYTEVFNKGDVSDIVYYFDSKGHRPLYEVIVIYRDEVSRNSVAQTLLGPPNSGKEWLFDLDDGYQLNAWTFQSKLIYAVAIPGTEWDTDGDKRIRKDN